MSIYVIYGAYCFYNPINFERIDELQSTLKYCACLCHYTIAENHIGYSNNSNNRSSMTGIPNCQVQMFVLLCIFCSTQLKPGMKI